MSGPNGSARYTAAREAQKIDEAEIVNIADQSNLTRSQFLMWLGQSVAPDIPLYNMIFTFTIEGQIVPETFQAAFQTLVDHSDAMRTVIEVIDGLPQQRILPHLPYPVEFVDLSSLPDAEQAFRDWLEGRKVRRLNLGVCSFDSVLLKLAPEQFKWYFNQHHILSDAWSTVLIYRQMARFYRLAREGRLPEAPGLNAYQAYVEYEREFRQTGAYQQAQTYWHNKLAEPVGPVDFFGRRLSGKSNRVYRLDEQLGEGRTRRLKALAQTADLRLISQDLTLYTIFLTILFAYLHRISGQSKLRLGSPFHNRSSAAFKETIGLFIELGVLQVDISPGETFASLLKKVRNEVFADLRSAQPGISNAEYNRAYNVLLNYVQATFPDFDGLPAQSAWIHSGYGDSYHGLRLQVHDFDQANNILLHFDFNEEVFEPAQRRQAIHHFLRLMDAFLTDRNGSIQQVNLLSDAETEQLLVDFNRTNAPVPAEKTVVQLFEEQVARTPDAVALRFDDQRLTYAQLNKQANHLAHFLTEHRIGPGQIAALCLDRSPEAVIAILGTLKAGGGYVPLDAALPPERLALMLTETEAPVVLTMQRFAANLPGSKAKIVCLDTDWPAIEAGPAGNPSPAAAPDNLAYVIYTSGSTGKPKGAMVRHSNLINYVWWAKNFYLQGQKLDFPLFSSLSFDLTVTSVYVPLVSGGSIVIYGQSDMGNLVILDVIKDNLVDIIKLTPAHLSLIKEINLAGTRLQKMILGGEDLKRSLAKNANDLFGGNIEIYNEYGPTEATVGCMIHHFNPNTDLAASVPIGRPISNAQVYILDDYLNPVLPGIIGEMCIGGAGVARGYLKRPELTAAKFVDDPLQPGAILYRTGDLACWTPDGQMQFLGRADHQVKVKGYRVELGEIESNLLAHPHIEAAVVTVVQPQAPSSDSVVKQCAKCGLPDTYPGAVMDAEGICNTCRDFDAFKDRFQPYFKTSAELQVILDRAKQSKTGKYDCMVLYSGGKDSSYMLYQLVKENGMTPLVFSLDNGYISAEAKENIRRVTDDLGVDLVFGRTPHMNAVFVDSLKRHSNVCDGCFKVIYTLSINLARKKGIKYIFTGLARGQLFETRLSDMFEARIFDVDEIDQTVLAARKAYHRIDDAVTQLLDVSVFEDDAIFDEIQLVDFYRYTDVPLQEVYHYLDRHASWVRPSDTGRSTNCLINDVGIYIHKKERGYHNYALPYSWDVRVGHKTRSEAIDDLDDDIDEARVRQILAEIGYDEPETGRAQLAAYFVASQSLTTTELRQFLSQRLPDYMIPTYFLPLDQMPLTTNGKIDRTALPDPTRQNIRLYNEFVAPVTTAEKTLAKIWAEVFRLEHVGIHDNFFDLGGDSIVSIQIIAKAGLAGLHFSPQQLFNSETIANLAPVAEATAGVQAEQGLVTGPAGLMPIQHWFFDQKLPQPEAWNMALLVDVSENMRPDLLEQALQYLLTHHDVLRARYVLRDHPLPVDDPAGWQQTIAESAPSPPFRVIDLNGLPETEQQKRIEQTIACLEAGHNLAEGRLIGAAYFTGAAPQSNRLFITIHHLAVDGFSWNILLQDLKTAHDQLSRGQAVSLPAKTISMKGWAEGLAKLAQTGELKSELGHWLSVFDGVGLDIPLDMPAGDNSEESTEEVLVSLDVAETQALLTEAPAAYNTQINDILLTALAQTLVDWTGQSSLLINLEGHGREDILASAVGLQNSATPARTVGWFTSIFPVKLTLPAETHLGERLKAIKEQLRTIPNKGIGFGLLRYLCREDEVKRQLAGKPSPQVLFNYLGQLDAALPNATTFRLNQAPIGRHGPRNPRTHALEINAWIMGGQFQISWTYSKNLHRPETIRRLAAQYIAALKRLIDHCLSPEAGGFTPSDFPLANLDEHQLDQLANILDALE